MMAMAISQEDADLIRTLLDPAVNLCSGREALEGGALLVQPVPTLRALRLLCVFLSPFTSLLELLAGVLLLDAGKGIGSRLTCDSLGLELLLLLPAHQMHDRVISEAQSHVLMSMFVLTVTTALAFGGDNFLPAENKSPSQGTLNTIFICANFALCALQFGALTCWIRLALPAANVRNEVHILTWTCQFTYTPPQTPLSPTLTEHLLTLSY